ncbi:MAG: hypothetical protein GY696_08425 [Gammaproteobacteria bacterium]|nr:hypothetical protein [Gammaproteobacteria bacterium]
MDPRNPLKLRQWATAKKPAAEMRTGESPRSKPMKVIEVLGKRMYRLDDSSSRKCQVPNARKLMHYFPPPPWEIPGGHRRILQYASLQSYTTSGTRNCGTSSTERASNLRLM